MQAEAKLYQMPRWLRSRRGHQIVRRVAAVMETAPAAVAAVAVGAGE